MNSEFLFTAYRTIRTGDFLLRPLFYSDRDDLLEIYSNYESIRYQSEYVMSSLEQIDEMLAILDKGAQNHYFLRWGVEYLPISKVIGVFSLHHIDYRNKHAQFGYIVSEPYWHRGIASTLLKDMTQRLLGEDRFIRIELLIHPENIASIKTAEKCGYVREGHLRKYAYNVRTGAFDDRLIYSKVFDNQEENT